MTATHIAISIVAFAWVYAGLYGGRLTHRAWVEVMHHDITYPWPWHWCCVLMGPVNIAVALTLRHMWRK